MTFKSFVKNSTGNSISSIQPVLSKLSAYGPLETDHDKPKERTMWTSADLVLKTIMHYAGEVAKWEEIEESKICMFLFGMLAVIFLPVLTISVLFDLVLLILIKVTIPFVSVILMMSVGLPAIAVLRWIYNTYRFISAITANYYIRDTKELRRPEGRVSCKKHKYSKKVPGHPRFYGDTVFSRENPLQFTEYNSFEEAALDL